MGVVTLSGDVLYVTTPIYYPNAVPHIGHAYTTVFADVLARYYRLLGRDVYYLTGTDEHGLKLQRTAERLGKHPKELVDEMSEVFKKYWSMLNISFDRFIRTTDPDHERVVKEAINRLYKGGMIYKAKYTGWYCVDCERFYGRDEYEVINGRPYCPAHRKPLEWLEEDTYYFKLSLFKDYLVNVLEGDVVYPRSYAVEVLSKIRREGLRDVSIARPKDRVWWGIEVPFDPNYTVYVWFDALLNYLTGAGYLEDEERFKHYWPAAHHIIGKDILWFHTAIWFAMLKALNLSPPKKVLVHAYLINRGFKIGKSSGNVVPIEDLLNRYRGSDGLRYILMRVFNMAKDVDVTTELFDTIYNSELADTLGNLVRRVGVLAKKKLRGEVVEGSIDEHLEILINKTKREFDKALNNYDPSEAIEAVMKLLRESNAYVNKTRPWESDNPSKELYTLLEAVRTAITLLSPIIPQTAEKAARALGFKITNPQKTEKWDRYRITQAPILFKKIRSNA